MWLIHLYTNWYFHSALMPTKRMGYPTLDFVNSNIPMYNQFRIKRLWIENMKKTWVISAHLLNDLKLIAWPATHAKTEPDPDYDQIYPYTPTHTRSSFLASSSTQNKITPNNTIACAPFISKFIRKNDFFHKKQLFLICI